MGRLFTQLSAQGIMPWEPRVAAVFFDDPDLVPADRLHCLPVGEDIVLAPPLLGIMLRGGLYARQRYKGPYAMRNPREPLPIPGVVAAAFEALPEPTRSQLLRIRRLIFEVAETTPGVGALTETLKWGEPAYLTEASRSGSTIRLGVPKSQEHTAAILFNCRTTLVETFRAHFPDAFAYQGNRAILILASAPLQEPALAICLAMALTYHHQIK